MNRSNKHIFIFLTFVGAALQSSPVFAAGLGSGQSLGDVMLNTYTAAGGIPKAMSALSYIAGLLYAVIAIIQFRDHVTSPQQVPISTPIKRFIAAGCFLSLPFLADAAIGTILGEGEIGSTASEMLKVMPQGNPGELGDADRMIYDFVNDIYGPMNMLFSIFCYVTAIGFLILGIHRLTKTEKEGVTAPTGIGTITTFLVAGAMFAAADMMGIFTNSLFGQSGVKTYATINSDVIEGEDAERIATIIESVLMFVKLVGTIAFIRGLIVLRNVADGKAGGNASLAQAIVFMIAGTIAINLGEFINILQNTIGVAGISFT